MSLRLLTEALIIKFMYLVGLTKHIQECCCPHEKEHNLT